MLTVKQRRALNRAPKKQRQALMASFRGQQQIPRNLGEAADSSMLRGIKQGTGKSVTRAFGSTLAGVTDHCDAFDAFHHCHAPLPRAIGSYTVVRSTQLVDTNKILSILGPVYDRTAGRWSDIAAVSFNSGSSTIGGSGNTSIDKFAVLGGNSWNGCQAVPAAFSVQVMNPNALQTTSGIVYIGRIRTALKLSEDLSTTVSDLANFLVSYNNPRLCSAAKLAFRGVQVDLVPYNMSELANFTALSSPTFTQYGAASPNPYGFAPMFIYNPNNISLQLLICAEWRVRFDPSNPAQATHIYHPPMEESWWHRAQQSMEAMGNGVVDIAERVANTGQAVYNAMGSMYAVARGAGAIRNAAQLALL